MYKSAAASDPSPPRGKTFPRGRMSHEHKTRGVESKRDEGERREERMKQKMREKGRRETEEPGVSEGGAARRRGGAARPFARWTDGRTSAVV